LEGPEAGVYYRGKGEINDMFGSDDNGSKIRSRFANKIEITLPNYVDNLATEFTVQVTQEVDCEADPCEHDFANLRSTSVINNKFTVFGGKCKFFWHVHGKRGHVHVEPIKDSVKVKGDGPYKYI
jgi:hypothetical protein